MNEFLKAFLMYRPMPPDPPVNRILFLIGKLVGSKISVTVSAVFGATLSVHGAIGGVPLARVVRAPSDDGRWRRHRRAHASRRDGSVLCRVRKRLDVILSVEEVSLSGLQHVSAIPYGFLAKYQCGMSPFCCRRAISNSIQTVVVICVDDILARARFPLSENRFRIEFFSERLHSRFHVFFQIFRFHWNAPNGFGSVYY